MTALFGLIGKKLGHSFSKGYHNTRFKELGIDARYENFELDEIGEFAALRNEHPELVGANVTVPYKSAVIPYLDALSPEALAIGAVNTILFSSGKSTGFNTDAGGFRDSLLNWLGSSRPQAMVLGTGGAAKAVCFTLRQLGIEYVLVSRSSQKGDLCYGDIDDRTIGRYTLIINTTPVGMAPETDAMPAVPMGSITPEHRVFDLIYNPEKTLFLESAERWGARIKNGLEMLHRQADLAWAIWRKHL